MNPRQPQSDRNTITLVARLLRDKLIAPFVLTGRSPEPPSLLIWNNVWCYPLSTAILAFFGNLSGRMGVAVLRAIEASCAKLLYLPNCSPDPNSIEQAVS